MTQSFNMHQVDKKDRGKMLQKLKSVKGHNRNRHTLESCMIFEMLSNYKIHQDILNSDHTFDDLLWS